MVTIFIQEVNHLKTISNFRYKHNWLILTYKKLTIRLGCFCSTATVCKKEPCFLRRMMMIRFSSVDFTICRSESIFDESVSTLFTPNQTSPGIPRPKNKRSVLERRNQSGSRGFQSHYMMKTALLLEM